MGEINTYSYAMASPLVKIDPEGLATCLYDKKSSQTPLFDAVNGV